MIVGHGDKHLIGVTTSRAPPTGTEETASPGDDTWIATANHPVWVVGKGWTDAEDLEAGELTVGATGAFRVVEENVDYGWLPERTVYNLSVANVHTFVVGQIDRGTLVHNSSGASCSIADNYKKGKAWEAELAEVYKKSGAIVNTKVPSIVTPHGRRFPDMAVTIKGKTRYIEAKTGRSRYNKQQRAADKWIRDNLGIRTTVVRRR